MKITGLHLLLTYQCTFECDHCFVWGSPWQSGVMTIPDLRAILAQAADLKTIRSIYFEGGEPFLYYPALLWGVREAIRQGFSVGIVSNAYWANSLEDAQVALEPLADMVEDLSVSSDLFHWSEPVSRQVQNACRAAEQLGIPTGTISIAQPEAIEASEATGQLPEGESGVMFRGRAAVKLSEQAPQHPWEEFIDCPHEDLKNPGRVHLDPGGDIHICQGIRLGNIFDRPLSELLESCDPAAHPITGPLLRGGPAGLVREYGLPHREAYADACHLCYEARANLRARFPAELGPDQMYGVYDG
jgi:MoaA/NifB/PqqE/SkfB family radical SAM enzyme